MVCFFIVAMDYFFLPQLHWFRWTFAIENYKTETFSVKHILVVRLLFNVQYTLSSSSVCHTSFDFLRSSRTYVLPYEWARKSKGYWFPQKMKWILNYIKVLLSREATHSLHKNVVLVRLNCSHLHNDRWTHYCPVFNIHDICLSWRDSPVFTFLYFSENEEHINKYIGVTDCQKIKKYIIQIDRRDVL